MSWLPQARGGGPDTACGSVIGSTEHAHHTTPHLFCCRAVWDSDFCIVRRMSRIDRAGSQAALFGAQQLLERYAQEGTVFPVKTTHGSRPRPHRAGCGNKVLAPSCAGASSILLAGLGRACKPRSHKCRRLHPRPPSTQSPAH